MWNGLLFWLDYWADRLVADLEAIPFYWRFVLSWDMAATILGAAFVNMGFASLAGYLFWLDLVVFWPTVLALGYRVYRYHRRCQQKNQKSVWD